MVLNARTISEPSNKTLIFQSFDYFKNLRRDGGSKYSSEAFQINL